MLGVVDLFPMILVAAVAAVLAALPASSLARRLGLVDVPGSAPHKQHAHSTPDSGGIALVFAIAAGIAVVGFPLDSTVAAILLGVLLIGLWGIWDDRVGLPPAVKLIGQIIAATLVIQMGLHIRLFPSVWLNYLLTYLWIVGLTNAFNFVDSMDGLALGLSGIAAAFFMLVTLDSGQLALSELSAIVIGAAAGLYYFNSLPAKLFLGDSGAQMLGMLLAGIGMAYNPVGLAQEVSWFTPIMVLGIPIFDTTLVVFDRLRKGQPVYVGRLDHTYHRLRRMGLSQNRAVLSMHLTASGLGLVSFIILSMTPLGANLVNGAVILAGICAILLLLRVQSSPGNDDSLERDV